jgi:hypothetical protein
LLHGPFAEISLFKSTFHLVLSSAPLSCVIWRDQPQSWARTAARALPPLDFVVPKCGSHHFMHRSVERFQLGRIHYFKYDSTPYSYTITEFYFQFSICACGPESPYSFWHELNWCCSCWFRWQDYSCWSPWYDGPSSQSVPRYLVMFSPCKTFDWLQIETWLSLL